MGSESIARVAKEYAKTRTFWKFSKVTANPKDMENLKRSWKKSWNLFTSKEYEPAPPTIPLGIVAYASVRFLLVILEKRRKLLLGAGKN